MKRRMYWNKKKTTVLSIITKLKKYSFVTEILNQSIMYFKVDKFIEKLDNNPNILCFGKYIFDLLDCQWKDSLPSHYCSLKCGVEKEDIDDKYLNLVNNIISDIYVSNDVKTFAINELSLFLSGVNQQKFYIWLGNGANGKTLLSNYLMNCFGDYYVDFPTSLITGKEAKATEANPQLARGRGRRVAVFSEPEEGSKLNNSTVKRLCGGERVLYRELYGNPMEYFPQFKMIILCNTKFELQDVADDSIPRRLRYINHKTKFVDNPLFDFQKKKNEEYLSQKFIDKIKGSFMYLLIENYKKLKQNNFKYEVPKEIQDDQKIFLDDNDEIKVFLKENYEITNNEKDYISCKSIFEQYKKYIKLNNQLLKIKEKNFKERLMSIVPYKERMRWREDNKLKEIRSVFTNIKGIEQDSEDIIE